MQQLMAILDRRKVWETLHRVNGYKEVGSGENSKISHCDCTVDLEKKAEDRQLD